MRSQTGKFLNKFIEEKQFKGDVLDVGSGYTGGERLRSYIKDGTYTGLDMNGKMENVDLAMNAHDIKTRIEPESFDMVMSFDTFEHDDKFWETLEGMKYVLKKGGYMLIGVPSLNCPEHSHPKDYYRFMPQIWEVFMDGFDDVYVDMQKDDPQHDDNDEIYMWGRKV